MKRLGAWHLGGDRVRFEVWAPLSRKVEVHLLTPRSRLVPLTPERRGYHVGEVEEVPIGARYLLRLEDGTELPDPASRRQPDGVDGPSEVIDGDWPWKDQDWRGIALKDLVLYEMHVGTFSSAGGFEGVVPVVEALKAIGVDAIELMPVAACQAACPFAIDDRYGGAAGLRRLVEACHEIGAAVVVDVLHEHLGAHAQRFEKFGPYFDPSRRTPYGPALNLDGPQCDEVRRYVIDAILSYVRDFHVDGIRVGRAHLVPDRSARPFLRELVQAVREEADRLGRRVHVFASGEENDVRLVEGPGPEFDAQWSPDFGNALHALLTDDLDGVFEDYGRVADLARAWQHGFAYEGQYSKFRQRRHGSLSRGVPGERFIVSAQDHEHLSRTGGQRLAARAGLDACRLAAGLVLLAPRVPMLFMGEEYGETEPFTGTTPLSHDRRRLPGHRHLRELYAELLRLRRDVAPLREFDPARVETHANEARKLMTARRTSRGCELFLAFHFGASAANLALPVPPGRWRVLVDSEDARWGGKGTAVPQEIESVGEIEVRLGGRSFVVFERVHLP